MAGLPRSRALRAILGGVVLLPPLVAAGAYFTLTGSVARLDGAAALPGLSAPVTVSRDVEGVPSVHGGTRVDVARATGYLHAQERFFQMDLLRRRAAGELSELIGAATVALDERVRIHRFRALAGRVVAQASPAERRLIDAYVAGVNAGLGDLRARPWEYLVLRASPAAWTPEDSVLCVLAMFLTLHDTGEKESTLAIMRDALPAELFEYLAPRGTLEWDAPLTGGPIAVAPMPGPDILNLRAAPRIARAYPDADRDDPSARAALLGSNNWAVAGSRTVDGGALVANDMHLDIAVPNIWYRVRLEWRDGAGQRSVTGVSLPGSPGIVAGSNGAVAWGFTNTQADWTDLVVLDAGPEPGSYMAPGGPRKIERVPETIRVRDQPDRALEVAWTAFGPVVDKDHAGRPRALRWTAHDAEAVNLGLIGMETAATIEEALEVAHRAGMPPQNLMMAARDGRIAWTIAGRIPRRVGFEGRLPVSWSDGQRGWSGWLSSSEYPRVVAPAEGLLWTANARTLSGPELALVGEGNYPLGARQKQIRDGLRALEKASADDLLKIQLDDRAVFLERWQKLALTTLEGPAGSDPLSTEARGLVQTWGGRADPASVGYRIVRAFRAAVFDRVFAPLVAPCVRLDPAFSYGRVWQAEGPLWDLVSREPVHMLDPAFPSWESLRSSAMAAALADLTKGGRALKDRTWGERNTARIQHPLSRAVPALSAFLDMPADPLPGDDHMPRVGSPSNGASERFVVSPGREDRGIFHMPVGQASHPLSPYFGAGHGAWIRGNRTPFLPGPPRWVLTLTPAP